MDEVQDIQEIARGRVARLIVNWDWPEPQILEDIVALGEAAIPAIEAALTPERLAAAETDGAANLVVYYLIGILGELPTQRAIPLLAFLFSQVSDDLIDSLPNALYPHGPAAIEALLPVMGDSSLRQYPRTLAAGVAVNLAGKDAALRAKIADTLRPHLAAYVQQTEPLSEEEMDVVSWFVNNLAELADPEARPLIEAAFEADLVDTDIVDQKFVRKAYHGTGVEPYCPNPPSFLSVYQDDYKSHERALTTERKTSTFFNALGNPGSQPVVLGPRIGRNDPCWCGSGKKYKKCHLAEDEKLGR